MLPDPTEAARSHALPWSACFGIVALRLLQGLLLRTYWTPDEFWQTHEVAHWMAFGCGHLTWEWQPEWMIRGPAHPLLFAALYRLLELLGLDSAAAVAAAPRAAQSLLAAAADLATHRLAAQSLGPEPARWVLFCQMSNWFNGYVLVRPYSNSLEAVLAAVVFARFTAGARLLSWLAPAAAACVLRPTSAILWLCPWAFAVATDQRPIRRLGETLLIFVIAMATSVALDTAFYGKLTCSTLNFFRFNFLEGHAAMYGTHHAFWYLSEGLPAMLGTMLPLLFQARFFDRSARVQVLSGSLVLTVLLYSLSPHKELRFLMPCMPLLMLFAGSGLSRLFLKAPAGRSYVLFGIVVSNLLAFSYLALRHQRAPLACVERLRQEMRREPEGFSVDFLTTCHATPYAAHLHAGRRCADLRFLDCSPTRLADGGLTRDGTDSDLLVRQGPAFLEEYYQRPSSRRPRFVVTSEEALGNVTAVLRGYRQVARFSHNFESSEALVLLRQT